MTGDPVTPRGHRNRKLNAQQQATLKRVLDRHPLASNRTLAHSVGGAIAERPVSDYLAGAQPPFTRKVIQKQEPEELTEDWKEVAREWVAHVKHIPMNRRIYADETAIYDNEAHFE